MKVRWLGNSCIEVLEPKHIVIDPNYVVEPEKGVEIVFVTHEHADHFDAEKYTKLNAKLVAPEAILKEFNLEGVKAEVGKEIEGVRILKSWCWGAKESYSYFYNGVLHTGDSAKFPDVRGIRVVFTACFPDFYDEYISEFKRLKPELVIPFHYSEKKKSNAEGLKKRLDEEGIKCRILGVGEEIEI
jgi:L-ascorbate metabolism protein UlaG (beta-lactamase superfamily)